MLRVSLLAALAAAAAAAAPPEATGGGPTAPSCRVVVSPLTLAAHTPARAAAAEPSPSKVPTVVRGLVDMYVYAVDGAIEPGFTLDADLPAGAAAADWSINMQPIDPASPRAAYVGEPGRPALVPGGPPAHVAFQVDAASQAFAPAAIRVNGAPCALDSKADFSAPVPLLPTPADPLRAAGLRRSWAAERPVSTNGSTLVGVDGKPLTIVGANWFGFENGQTIVDGLWGNVQNAVVADFATVAWRFKLLGFNTIRLPFSFQAFAQTPRDPTYRTCGNVTEGAVRASVIPPGVSVPASAPLWRMPAPITQTPGVCNDYVPRDSVKQRLLWAASFLAANGFYVVLDDHMAYDTLVLDDPVAWVDAWKSLAADAVADPVLKNRVMFDILNEPDSRGIKWDSGPGKGGYGMTALYEMAMDAIYSVAPSSLMLVEGTGQLGSVAMNWGDGFATDPAVIAAAGVQSAAPFFTKVLTKPYAANVVVSPHIYPPSVSTHTDPADVTGAGLARRLTTSFGYLTKRGFCAPGGGACRTFPVIFGETGSRFTSALDIAMLEDFAKYMQADAPDHAPVPNMIWWCWNANSGDTGGVVADNWLDILWNKVDWLTKAAGLKPWYKAAIESGGGSPAPAPAPPPPPPTVAPPSPAPTPAPTTPPPTTTPAPTTPPPTTTPAPPSPPPPPPPPTATPSPPSGFTCTAQIATQTWQSSSSTWSASINVKVWASGKRGVPYYASLYNLAYIESTAAWNWYPAKTPTNGWITGIVKEAWQALGEGSPGQVGLIVSGRVADLRPRAFTVAGTFCKVQYV